MNNLKIEDVTIRSANNLDKDRIVSLVSDILSEFNLQPEFDSSESDLIDIEATYLKSGGIFKIIEDDQKRLLGTFALLPIDKNTYKLRKMYLAPETRGVGLGGKMLDFTIDDALKIGFKTMILETMTVMEDAISLYTHKGFRLINRQPDSPRCELVFALDLVEEL